MDIFIFFFFLFALKFLWENSVYLDQMPHSAASELGLRCLHMSPKWVSDLLKRVKDKCS